MSVKLRLANCPIGQLGRDAINEIEGLELLLTQKDAEIERLKLMNYEVSSGNYDTHIFELKQKLALAVEALEEIGRLLVENSLENDDLCIFLAREALARIK